MTATRPTPNTGRADLISGGLSCVALVLAVYAVLRPTTAAPTAAEAEIAGLREELAALRHSVAVTRNQQATPGNGLALADVEQRLARVEASARLATPATGPDPADANADAANADAPERLRDGSPRYVDLVAANSAVAVAQLPDGSLVVKNRDPALAGSSMLVKARTADGRDENVTVTVPPAS